MTLHQDLDRSNFAEQCHNRGVPMGGGQGSSALGGLMDRAAGNPQILSAVAGLLPTVIDKLTPDGNLPDANSPENTLSSLLGTLA